MSSFAEQIAKVEIDADKPGRMVILGFDRQPLRDSEGSTNYIDLYSSDSEIARKCNRKTADRRLSGRGRVKITGESLESDGLELLVALTAGWGSIDRDGQAHAEEFSPQAARELYANPRNAEIRAQVDEYTADRANFSPALSKN